MKRWSLDDAREAVIAVLYDEMDDEKEELVRRAFAMLEDLTS